MLVLVPTPRKRRQMLRSSAVYFTNLKPDLIAPIVILEKMDSRPVPAEAVKAEAERRGFLAKA